MKKQLFFCGLLVILLAFGLIFVGCDNPASSTPSTCDPDDDSSETPGEPTTYTVTLDPNGGNPGSQTTVTGITSGGTATWNEDTMKPTMEDNMFLGWNIEADGSGTPFVFGTTPVTEDITIYAQWGMGTKVIFNLNGWTPTSAPSGEIEGPFIADSAAGSDRLIAEPALPVLPTGFTDGGWFDMADWSNGAAVEWIFLNDEVDDYAATGGTLTLYLKLTTEVAFDLRGGTDSGSSADTQTVQYGQAIVEPTSADITSGGTLSGFFVKYPNPEGWYKFGGTGTAGDFFSANNTFAKWGSTTTVTESNVDASGTTTLYARWKIEVTFDKNDSGGSAPDPTSATVLEGEKIGSAAITTPPKNSSGTDGTGWAKDTIGTDPFDLDVDLAEKDMMLYATYN